LEDRTLPSLFLAAKSYATGMQPYAVAVADVNGDGRPDLVVAYGGYKQTNTVGVLLGNGNGTFQGTVHFGAVLYPRSVAVADVNGDGHLDLVVANGGYPNFSVSVLLGNGNATFQSAVNFGVGRFPTSVAVADVKGDGIPDLVAANGNSDTVSVLLGNRNAATHFLVSAPGSATVGTPFTITVTAKTAGSQLDALYTGTVHFKSSDGSAMLPTDYTFTLADAGSHTFTVTLNSAGSQTITATDTSTSSITGKKVVTVTGPAPVSLTPDEAPPPGYIAAAALEALGSLVPGYRGPIASRSSDSSIALPGSYTSLITDAGLPAFTATLNPAGSRRIALAATATQSHGTPTVIVHVAGWAARVGQPFGPGVDMPNAADIDAFFAQDESKRRG
jgi:hypothetical protein